jgi:hypothetical protein
MAQFGTIADWLRYDDIRMAMTKRNLTGLAVGAIGQTIGKVVDEVAGIEKDEAEEAENPLNDFKNWELKTLEKTKVDYSFGDPIRGNKEVTLQSIKEPPTPAEQKETAQIEGAVATNIAPTEIEILNAASDTTNPTTIDIGTEEQRDSGQGYMYGGQRRSRRKQQRIKEVDVQGRSTNSTMLRRKAPFRRIEDELDYEALSKAQAAPSYLEEIGAAAAEGYNIRVKRDAYKRKAFDKAAESLDDNFSKLELEPSGFNSFDGTMQIMGKEMQKAFLDLEGMKYNMEPSEYLSARGNILSQPKALNSAISVLKQRVADFDDNRDTLSKGNNARTIDILDSLSKNEGSLKPEFINGVPYITGKTAGEKNVSVPISEIANGKNDFKFLLKADINAPLTALVDKYSKLKTEAEFKNAQGSGLKKTTLPVSVFKDSLMSDFDQILNSDAILRSVVADYMGADYDTFEEIKASGNDPKEMAKNQLYEMFKQKFDPYTQLQDITSYSRTSTNQQKLTAGERKIAKIKADLDKLPPLSSTTLSNYASQLDKTIYELREDPKTGSFYINDFKNKRRINLPSDPIEAKTEIAGYAGVTGYKGGQSQDLSLYNFDL